MRFGVCRDRGLRLMSSKSNPAHLQRMRDFKPETVLLSNIAHIGVNAEVKPGEMVTCIKKSN